ncbi:zinc finger protein 658B-like isoform X2 [Plodia interpunctella]|uniref:zinc finger protein 658B-like isoform X2 n=1 Tax=Plodia interpunctella TaxID=58824 RepID=UPI00236889F9|nr:zinc finger protein 658B-like isoform X2 [Plodia interpunctella]
MAESSEHWKIEKGLCRCCHSEGSFHQLSDICIVGEEEGFYADMLQLTLNISMKPVEKPLNMICDNCVHRVKDATAFKQQVLRCEAQFHEMYTKGVIKVGLTSVVKEEPESDGNDDSKMDAGGFEDNDEANTDVADSQSEPLAEVGLELCKKEPLTEDTDNRRKSLRTKKATSILEISLLTPKQQKPKQKPKPSKKLKKTKDASAAEDSTSKDTITPEAGIDYTERIVDGKTTYICNICEKNFTTGLYELRKHILMHHFNKRLYKCNICEETFKGLGPKRCHLLSIHGMEEVKVGNGFVIRLAVKVTCNTCQQEFPSEHSLRQHMTYKHKVRQCTECPMTFTSRRHVKLHKAEVHGIGMHVCGVCDFKHAMKAAIVTHQRKVHLKEKNVSCPDCGLKFFGPFQLKNHMVRHNPVKKYECQFCHKMFPRQSTMREHEKIHLGDKRRVCRVCDERFVQTASLSYHMKKYHPEAC